MQLGHFVEIALAGVRFNLLAQLVNLFAHMLAALRLRLFRTPDFFQIGGLFFQFDDFFFNQFQAFARGFVFFFLDRFALNLQLDQAAIQLVNHLGLGVNFNLDFGGRLIDQVDGLVGQKAVGDVAMAQLGRSHNGRVGDVHAMVDFVFFLQATQDGDGCLHRGFAHQNFLKTPLQRRIFLDVLAVFVQRGCAHAMQLATGQCGLEHIARVHGAFGLAGADHGVQLVNKDNRHAFVLGQLAQHGFQALFKLAAKLGTSEQ